MNAKKEIKKRAYDEFKVAVQEADESKKIAIRIAKIECVQAIERAYMKYQNTIT